MAEGDSGTFPIFNRRAPVIERVKERRKDRNRSSAYKYGKDLGQALTSVDPTERENEMRSMLTDIRDGMAESFDVQPQDIDIDLLSGVMPADMSAEDFIKESALKGGSVPTQTPEDVHKEPVESQPEEVDVDQQEGEVTFDEGEDEEEDSNEQPGEDVQGEVEEEEPAKVPDFSADE